MILNFANKGEVQIDMAYYIKEMLQDFLKRFGESDTAPTPASTNQMEKGQGRLLETKRAKQFHTTVAKKLFVSKRARPDIHPTIAVLCTRVKEPNESN